MADRGSSAKLLVTPLHKVNVGAWVPAPLPFPAQSWGASAKTIPCFTGAAAEPTTGQIWPRGDAWA